MTTCVSANSLWTTASGMPSSWRTDAGTGMEPPMPPTASVVVPIVGNTTSGLPALALAPLAAPPALSAAAAPASGDANGGIIILTEPGVDGVEAPSRASGGDNVEPTDMSGGTRVVDTDEAVDDAARASTMEPAGAASMGENAAEPAPSLGLPTAAATPAG